MVNKSININHPDTSIKTADGTHLQIADGGAVQVGYGISIDEDSINNASPETLSLFAGTIRFNKTTKKLEYCNGTSWVSFVTESSKDDVPTVYAMLF